MTLLFFAEVDALNDSDNENVTLSRLIPRWSAISSTDSHQSSIIFLPGHALHQKLSLSGPLLSVLDLPRFNQ